MNFNIRKRSNLYVCMHRFKIPLFVDYVRVTAVPTSKSNCNCGDHGNAIVTNQHALNYFNFMIHDSACHDRFTSCMDDLLLSVPLAWVIII